jgi:hypothetical protein
MPAISSPDRKFSRVKTPANKRRNLMINSMSPPIEENR